MKQKKRRWLAAFLVFGAVFSLCAALLGLNGVWDILWKLAVSLLAALAVLPGRKKVPAPIMEQPAPPPEESAVWRGQDAVRRIRELNDEIPDYRMSAKLLQIEILIASILDQAAKKPDRQKKLQQFLRYYLPTTIRLLEQYVQLQSVGMRGENVRQGMQQIESLLDKLIVAFQKQLDELFVRDRMDITAEIRVMEQMLQRHGLSGQNDWKE